MINRIAAMAAVLWFIVSIAYAQSPPPPAEFGSLTYPARGNVQLDEGTLDLWVISDFDTE